MSQRRTGGGPRREASERVLLRREQLEVTGWTLNLSRGGVRIVVEGPVQVGDRFEVTLGENTARPGCVVWIRDEADGQIVGVQFLDTNAPPPEESDPT